VGFILCEGNDDDNNNNNLFSDFPFFGVYFGNVLW
jgi:hypothetical protein